MRVRDIYHNHSPPVGDGGVYCSLSFLGFKYCVPVCTLLMLSSHSRSESNEGVKTRVRLLHSI